MVPIVAICLVISVIFAVIAYIYLKTGSIPPLKQKNVPKVLLTFFGLSVVSGALLAPASYAAAHSIVQHGAVSGYHQFLNGSVVSANLQHYTCSEDGPCDRTYDCDPYEVTVVIQDAYTDSNGNYHPEETEQVTDYHSCPYATDEYSYSLTVSYGFETQEVGIASHIFAADPKKWDRSEGLPSASQVYRGVPPQWQKAKTDLDNGNTDPVTTTGTYKNYILSSESTILKAHSDDIAQLTKLKLLPNPSANVQDPIHDDYLADKVSFVGFTPADAANWQDALMHFNAALGITKQGDMHIIAVRASAIPASVSPENYLNAVKADWLNNLGKYAIAKNTIVLILGVSDDGSTIQWSRATTGMPIGNGSMLESLSTDLANQPFTVDAVLGNTTGRVVDPNSDQPVSYQIGAGKAAQIIMQEFPFERACMGCTSKADKAKHGQGFVYLSTEIPLRGGARIWTLIIDAIVMGIMYGVAANFLSLSFVDIDGDDNDDPYNYPGITYPSKRKIKGKSRSVNYYA